jgi:hypothetical protein
MEEFQQALKEWYVLHLQGIERYSKEHLEQKKITTISPGFQYPLEIKTLNSLATRLDPI